MQAPHFGAAAASSAPSAVAQRAFVRAAEFAECGAAPSAVFECRWRFSWPLAGVLSLAAAVVSDVPDFV